MRSSFASEDLLAAIRSTRSAVVADLPVRNVSTALRTQASDSKRCQLQSHGGAVSARARARRESALCVGRAAAWTHKTLVVASDS